MADSGIGTFGKEFLTKTWRDEVKQKNELPKVVVSHLDSFQKVKTVVKNSWRTQELTF